VSEQDCSCECVRARLFVWVCQSKTVRVSVSEQDCSCECVRARLFVWVCQSKNVRVSVSEQERSCECVRARLFVWVCQSKTVRVSVSEQERGSNSGSTKAWQTNSPWYIISCFRPGPTHIPLSKTIGAVPVNNPPLCKPIRLSSHYDLIRFCKHSKISLHLSNFWMPYDIEKLSI